MPFLIAIVVVLIGGVVALALGRTGGLSVAMAEPVGTMGGRGLPEGPIDEADIADVRFDRTLRGYRMSEVDAVIDRLRAEIADRDARLRELAAVHAQGATPTPMSQPMSQPLSEPMGSEDGVAEGR